MVATQVVLSYVILVSQICEMTSHYSNPEANEFKTRDFHENRTFSLQITLESKMDTLLQAKLAQKPYPMGPTCQIMGA